MTLDEHSKAMQACDAAMSHACHVGTEEAIGEAHLVLALNGLAAITDMADDFEPSMMTLRFLPKEAKTPNSGVKLVPHWVIPITDLAP